jgi:hypothetical protein
MGTARRLTAARPRELATAWWAARFELRLRRRVPAARSHRALRRLVATAGLDPASPAASATTTQWHDLALALLTLQVTPARPAPRADPRK